MGQDVAVSDVGMCFGSYWAVRNIDVHIRSGEFFSFLGPSGCGKTTLLRLISGFMDPSEGQIRINGQDMRGIGPNKRHTAMIFQNLALFPLMTVAENIGFGLEIRGLSRAERTRKVQALLELVDLPGMDAQKVSDLSGGQMQRVAIARALAVEPAVLLLDEPLSALDLKLRKHMRTELRKIQRRTGVTFIYITHDQGEALNMSDRVGVMSVGRLEQVGSPDEIYNRPDTAFVASFVGENNRLKGRVQKAAGKLAEVETASGTLHCQNPQHLREGHASHLFIRPEAITLANGNGSGENCIACRVENHNFEGPYANIFLRTAGDEVLTMRLNNDGHTIALDTGQPVTVTFRAASAVALDRGERRHA